MGFLDPKILHLGVSEKIVDAATGTGTANSQVFSFPAAFHIADAHCTLMAVLTGAFTALLVDIEVSLDGGTTWQKIADWDVVAQKATRGDFGLTGLHRLNVTTFTAGTTFTAYIGVP